MASKLEKQLQYELKVSVDCLKNTMYIKIPDMPRFKGSSFIPEKPFDLIIAGYKKFNAIETKVHKKYTAWSFSDVEDDQVEALLKARDAGYRAYIFLNVRYGLGKKRVNFIRVFTIDEFIRIRDKADRKSMTVEQIDKGVRLYSYREDKQAYWLIERFLIETLCKR